MMLAGARDLRGGVEPAAAMDGGGLHRAIRQRGGWRRGVPFADVMVARFGDPLGRVGRPAPGSRQ